MGKAGGAPLSFQYANYEVAPDMFARLRDGGSKEEQNSLMEVLLDPKPPAVKENKNEGEDDRDRERDREDRDRPRDDYDRPRDDFDSGPPRGKGGGMRSDQKVQGRSVCRQFQRDGRCSYGDNCRFVHQGEDGRM